MATESIQTTSPADGPASTAAADASAGAAMVIEGHLTSERGNIEHAHDVTVQGNVGDDVRIQCGGTLEVQGLVEAADVRAGAGVRGNGGISGKGKGRIAAEGDISAKYVANATLVATGNVTAMMVAHSRITCGGTLNVTEGAALAGHLTATGGIACVALGSAASIKTIVESGIDENLRAIAGPKVAEVELLRAKANKIRTTVAPLMQNQKRLNAQQKERATELLFEADEFDTRAQEIIAELRRAYDAAMTRSKREITVSGTLYAGVVIRFPGCSTTIDDVLKGPLRVTTRILHNDTKIVLYYGNSTTAHSLSTHADLESSLVPMEKLFAPPAAPGAAKKAS